MRKRGRLAAKGHDGRRAELKHDRPLGAEPRRPRCQSRNSGRASRAAERGRAATGFARLAPASGVGSTSPSASFAATDDDDDEDDDPAVCCCCCCCHCRCAPAQKGRAANNCTTCFSGFKQKIEVISITVTFASQSSADLSSGRRPMSKSAEFCNANVIVVSDPTSEEV